jgi:hypothetical protein
MTILAMRMTTTTLVSAITDAEWPGLSRTQLKAGLMTLLENYNAVWLLIMDRNIADTAASLVCVVSK